MQRPQVYMDVVIGGRPTGRIVIELQQDIVPKTCENFRCLCTGERGTSRVSGAKLHLQGTRFHRVIPGLGMHGGDFVKGDGTGSESMWGCLFADETLAGPAGRHTGLGCVSMVNSGPDSNGSVFMIATADTPWLDHKAVVIGRVLEQSHNVLLAIEAVGTRGGAPAHPVVITECGQL